MGRALLIVGWVGTVGLVAAAAVGYTLTRPEQAFGHHLTLGLVSALLILFSHCWIMFYLIGTGKAIKQAVAEHGLDDALAEATKDLKNRSYPSLMLAILLVMATFILGGAGLAEVAPSWLHHALFWVTLVVQGRALLQERAVLVENELLMADIERRIAAP